jgi:ornithine lipid ester-linked acyl 2-hydroxylase
MSAWTRMKVTGFTALERMVKGASRVGDSCFYDPATFPWVSELESGYKSMQLELLRLLPYQDSIPCFQDISPEQAHITRDRLWKTFFLYFYGRKVRSNCALCPETVRLLKAIPGMRTAFFSVLMPNKQIPAHRGPYNGVLRYHLGLLIPKPASSCGIVVGGEKAHWEEGKSLIFDDTRMHRAWNLSSQPRAILFVDFLRPMRFPAALVSRAYVRYVSISPFIRTALARQKHWDKVLESVYEKTG